MNKIKNILKIVALFTTTITAFSQQIQNDPLNAIVKITSVNCEPNFILPWEKKMQRHASGSGVVVEGNYILTNAHNVAYSTYISVSKNNDGFPVNAKILAINHQCDLALLKVEDKSFFENITPLQIGETPPVQSQILVVGYPLGGDGISITQGIISRIETVDYAHSFFCNFLAAQLDAAINAGNSGGPAIFNGKIVGIAFQGRNDGEGLGYVIHTDIIKHFLRDAKDGSIKGFGDLCFGLGSLESPDARNFLKMKPKQSGVLVLKKSKNAITTPEINVGDVLLEIDNFKIMNNGNIKNERNETITFSAISDRKEFGDSVTVKVLRDGKEFESKVQLALPNLKVKPFLYETPTKYFVIGGYVFTNLSLSYIAEWRTSENPPPSELTERLAEEFDSADEEVVVLSQVLGDEVNLGYQNKGHDIIDAVNGKKIKNLKQLVEIIDAQKDGFVKIITHDKSQIILDIKKSRDAWKRIKNNYKIPSDRSDDLK